MAQVRTAIIWSPAPDDPYEDIMPGDGHELQAQVPPEGASEGDDPMYADRYAAEQLVLSVAQVYDTAWPLEADPTVA